MKIVTIFASNLFSFQYDKEMENELTRLLALWNDIHYLNTFIHNHHYDIPRIYSKEDVLNQIQQDAQEIDSILLNLTNDKTYNWSLFFKPLNNYEYYFVSLSGQKWRKRFLRLYAIKIDENCFVITGGTIKLHHLNREREHTQIEMDKLSYCRNFLQSNGVFDADSFFEFLNELK
jgi:hypothetical protein